MAKKLTKKDLNHFREMLKERRQDIFQLRDTLDDSWKGLQEKEVEFEETATKRQMSLGLEKLEERQKRQIEAIDEALRRMESGEYGLCRSCSTYIAPERLEAIPWTPVCARCAGEHEKEEGATVAREVREAELPPDYEGMSDNELKNAVYEQLYRDGRVELEELQVTVLAGVVHLEGALPGKNSHQILLEILQDTMGLPEIEDNLRIEQLAWQREGREPTPEQKKSEDDEVLQGEDINEEIFHARKSGKPVSPPDEFIPEKEQ